MYLAYNTLQILDKKKKQNLYKFLHFFDMKQKKPIIQYTVSS